MNITPHANNLPLATVVNPPTDSLRRDNVQREVISQTAAMNPSAAEKGVASEKERVKTPAQNIEEGVDFSAIQEQAELENSTINEREQRQGNEQESAQQNSQQEDLEPEAQSAETSDSTQASPSSEGSEDSTSPTPEERAIIRELEARDLEVRTHEQAHAAVGGRYTGAPSYSYETGPDGKRYAVEGEVSVDLSKPSSPEETIAKMRKVYDAALAPANPSTQDLRVAAEASRTIAPAQSELLQQQLSKESDENDLSKPLGGGGPQIESLNSDESIESGEFDNLIDSTIAAQEAISPSRDQEIDRRAVRIETFYLNINQAYERPSRSQFELTA
ncbi:hypothetical protein HII17_15800 [Thalassotalea sp. M1531]|uniref:Catalase n=1 Tax=Thalassotalea algicola TaxID=2716224 RepID=A0A7Y0Q8A5_9GAMM|nr:putative metalloprotease CJM1_0395 family protein [Thalassotalea algicola]NMP33021.1 hypothetical protein [Thalassotalea algicola]